MKTSFAERLKLAMFLNNINEHELSDMTNCNIVSLLGGGDADMITISKISRALKVSIDWLMDRPCADSRFVDDIVKQKISNDIKERKVRDLRRICNDLETCVNFYNEIENKDVLGQIECLNKKQNLNDLLEKKDFCDNYICESNKKQLLIKRLEDIYLNLELYLTEKCKIVPNDLKSKKEATISKRKLQNFKRIHDEYVNAIKRL